MFSQALVTMNTLNNYFHLTRRITNIDTKVSKLWIVLIAALPKPVGWQYPYTTARRKLSYFWEQAGEGLAEENLLRQSQECSIS